ncbi:MAG: carboxypeptidase regulatory-like domain-containing protein [Phycisphaerae bacterium]|nr:carboxypeptidase regulatory-like domain-containing protein [Phycisphaerae bacterium]
MRLMSLLLVAGLPLAECRVIDDPVVCTDIFVYGINVTLTDADTGAPIAGATLTLTEGTYSEILEAFPGSGQYVGAGERAGTYTLTADADGYESKTVTNIVIGADECHVIPVVLTIELTPAE